MGCQKKLFSTLPHNQSGNPVPSRPAADRRPCSSLQSAASSARLLGPVPCKQSYHGDIHPHKSNHLSQVLPTLRVSYPEPCASASGSTQVQNICTPPGVPPLSRNRRSLFLGSGSRVSLVPRSRLVLSSHQRRFRNGIYLN